MKKLIALINTSVMCVVLCNSAYSAHLRNVTNSTDYQPALTKTDMSDILGENSNMSDISELIVDALNGNRLAQEMVMDMVKDDCSLSSAQARDEQCLALSLNVYERQPTYFKSLVSFERFKYIAVENQVNLLLNPENKVVRDVYNQMITGIYEQEFKERFSQEHANGMKLSQATIKDAINARNNTKVALQSLTSVTGQIGIYLRNYYKYGSIYGPHTSFSFVCDNGYLCYEPSFSSINKGIKIEKLLSETDAYKAFKTDGGDLGLVGNNFGEKIEIAKQLNKECSLGTRIYPEAISNSYMKCYQEASQNIDACNDIHLKPSKVSCAKDGKNRIIYRGTPIDIHDL
ncbi:hypothetical protein [Cysteiniphilum sp. 6C5]|uniref:hypothetical protein n=1 Tax=unclassified Cysteiniphilum TaxID=2610889 RepID=UPI003F845985